MTRYKKQNHADARIRSQTHPKNFEVGSVESRAAARSLLAPRQRFQMVIAELRQPNPYFRECPSANLETSTVERQIWPDGNIFELVLLDGHADELTDAQLDAWIKSHPIASSPQQLSEAKMR